MYMFKMSEAADSKTAVLNPINTIAISIGLYRSINKMLELESLN